jgi:hypothetical protein
MDGHWKLEELEPSRELDRRVRRRALALTNGRRPAPRAAPLLPFEGAVYAVVLAVYSIHAGVRAVHLFHEARAAQVSSAAHLSSTNADGSIEGDFRHGALVACAGGVQSGTGESRL